MPRIHLYSLYIMSSETIDPRPKLTLKFTVPAFDRAKFEHYKYYQSILTPEYHELPKIYSQRLDFLKKSCIDIKDDNVENTPNLIDLYSYPIKRLGKGSYSSVKLFKSPMDGKKYALKFFNAKSSALIGNILREFVITNIIECPQVIKSYDLLASVNNPGKMVIVEEYFDAVTLYDAMYKLPAFRNPSYADMVFNLTVEAVRNFHGSGYFHNDLKPENILYDFNHKEIKIIDLGFSYPLHKIVDAKRMRQHLSSGTEPYLPPEMNPKLNAFISDPTMARAGIAKDIWSLGIIYYEMLTQGEPLWDLAHASCTLFASYYNKRYIQKVHNLFVRKNNLTEQETLFWYTRNHIIHRLLTIENDQRFGIKEEVLQYPMY